MLPQVLLLLSSYHNLPPLHCSFPNSSRMHCVFLPPSILFTEVFVIYVGCIVFLVSIKVLGSFSWLVDPVVDIGIIGNISSYLNDSIKMVTILLITTA